eukprot:1161491-Pelagomonas_calceolata.AAC.19
MHSTYIQTYVHTYTHTPCTHTRARTHTHTHKDTHTDTHRHTHEHTHTHTLTHSSPPKPHLAAQVGLVLRVRKRARKHGPQHQASGSNPQPASRPPTGSSANTLPYATLAAAPPAGELAFKLSAMELHPPCPLVASSRSSSSRFQAPTLKAQQHANCACVGGPLPSQYGVSLQSLPEPQGTLPVRARGDGAECHAPEFDVPQSRAPPGSQILPSIQQSQQHQEEQQQQNIEVQGGQRQQQEQQQQEQQQEQECKDNEAEEQEEEEGLQSDEEAWEAAGAAATAHLERAVWGNVLRSEGALRVGLCLLVRL